MLEPMYEVEVSVRDITLHSIYTCVNRKLLAPIYKFEVRNSIHTSLGGDFIMLIYEVKINVGEGHMHHRPVFSSIGQ